METILNTIKGLKVAVIGDIMLDHYVWGDAERISPEAPVPVVNVAKDSYVPGGAANVALNVTSMGGKAILCGRTANDDAGEQLMTQLNSSGVSYDGRFGRNDAPTIVKTRVIVRNQQLCRIDREESPSEYTLEEDEEWAVVEEKLKQADAVIFSDYYKGIVTKSLIARVQKVTGSHVLLAMDPKPRRKMTFEGLDLMTPNRVEALAMSGVEMEPHGKFPAKEVCEALWNRYKCKHLVVTMGGDGMLLCTEGSDLKFMPTVAKEVYDVSGAGDTVVAALALALRSGASLEDAASFANTAAGVVVSKLGTASVTPEEILEYMPKSEMTFA